jgi:hypothetical protein
VLLSDPTCPRDKLHTSLSNPGLALLDTMFGGHCVGHSEILLQDTYSDDVAATQSAIPGREMG